MVPDGMHLRVLKELADAMRPLFIILKRSWQSGDAPSDWKNADSISIVKKGNPGNKRPVSLTSVLGKDMELHIG